ncbi:hypothetical protein H4W34_000598 [Actinomadura algeriensis]|uniref:Uncharacterized protein n=1 Tax=Actinomadura algeriensis TaxID=1679523 RepID=A0ABR9JJN1_9ACTN|nr:hypothetical protein [Actinomadura algeriensis]
MTSQVPDVLASARLGPVTLRNRITEAATHGAAHRVPSTEPARGSARV